MILAMGRVLAAVTLMLAVVSGLPDALADPLVSSDVVRTWNNQALDTARALNLSDAQAARAYAMVNVAMYDAVNGIVSKLALRDREHALVPPDDAPFNGHIVAAAAAAARTVLAGLFPTRAAIYDTQLTADLAPLHPTSSVNAGKAWGIQVGNAVLLARQNDGSTPNETQLPPDPPEPGKFRAAWSGVQFRNLAPFGIADSRIYVGSGPPALDGLDYAAAFAEVKLLGNGAIADDAKLATFRFWSLGGRTNQPPGAWIQITEVVSSSPELGLVDATRLFALVSMAMVDTVAPTYMTKFTFQHWRPTTAIQNADTDPDPGWTARAGSVGGSPEYWSGHSTFSGSAARALAGFFCNDNISFTFTADTTPTTPPQTPPNAPRTYPSFSAAAAEAGVSRVVGGFHFSFSNGPAIGVGQAIADEILTNKLLFKQGPTHFGACPL